MGQITEFKLIGNVEEKTIAGTERYHVMEGAQGVDLSVTVQWTHEEIAAIGYNQPQQIDVQIMSDRPAALPNWLSWIDSEGDVHFPQWARGQSGYGRLWGRVIVRTPSGKGDPRRSEGQRPSREVEDRHARCADPS